MPQRGKRGRQIQIKNETYDYLERIKTNYKFFSFDETLRKVISESIKYRKLIKEAQLRKRKKDEMERKAM